MTTFFYLLMFLGAVVFVPIIVSQGESRRVMYSLFCVMLIVVINFGYLSRSIADDMNEAMLAQRLINLEGTVFPVFFLFSISKFFKVELNIWTKIISISLGVGLLCLKWSGLKYGWYYQDAVLDQRAGGANLVFTYTNLHYVSYIFLFACMVAVYKIWLNGFKDKETVPRQYVNKVAIWASLFICCKAIDNTTDLPIRLLPLSYLVCDYGIVSMLHSQMLYSATDVSTLMHKARENYGFVTLDLKGNYLDANSTAVRFFPMLAGSIIGKPLSVDSPEMVQVFHKGLVDFKNGDKEQKVYWYNKSAFRYSVSYFYISNFTRRSKGYLFRIEDDTKQQNMIHFMGNYNEQLGEEVKKQTKRVTEIQRKVVLGMADIVENRDTNTGGHVKRTSEVIQILMDVIRENNLLQLDDEFITDIIRAAPMHDLGKISIDSSILCKPGKLTEEEFAIMRSHAAKSGEIVDIILDGVEEPHFVKVAHNVARYHHERWDGKGYPDGLKGEEIPLEARIMAVADVYDALASKRAYKSEMPFEQIAEIMLSDMGTHFDPQMEELFQLARPRLEAYYSKKRQ